MDPTPKVDVTPKVDASVAELKQKLKERNLKITGTKNELIKRVQTDLYEIEFGLKPLVSVAETLNFAAKSTNDNSSSHRDSMHVETMDPGTPRVDVCEAELIQKLKERNLKTTGTKNELIERLQTDLYEVEFGLKTPVSVAETLNFAAKSTNDNSPPQSDSIRTLCMEANGPMARTPRDASVAELKQKLKERNLQITGTKNELIKRLQIDLYEIEFGLKTPVSVAETLNFAAKSTIDKSSSHSDSMHVETMDPGTPRVDVCAAELLQKSKERDLKIKGVDVSELKQKLKDRNLKITGTKNELIQRLQTDLYEVEFGLKTPLSVAETLNFAAKSSHDNSCSQSDCGDSLAGEEPSIILQRKHMSDYDNSRHGDSLSSLLKLTKRKRIADDDNSSYSVEIINDDGDSPKVEKRKRKQSPVDMILEDMNKLNKSKDDFQSSQPVNTDFHNALGAAADQKTLLNMPADLDQKKEKAKPEKPKQLPVCEVEHQSFLNKNGVGQEQTNAKIQKEMAIPLHCPQKSLQNPEDKTQNLPKIIASLQEVLCLSKQEYAEKQNKEKYITKLQDEKNFWVRISAEANANLIKIKQEKLEILKDSSVLKEELSQEKKLSEELNKELLVCKQEKDKQLETASLEHNAHILEVKEQFSKQIQEIIAQREQEKQQLETAALQNNAYILELKEQLCNANAETQQRNKHIEKLTSEKSQMQAQLVSLEEKTQIKSRELQKTKQEFNKLSEESKEKKQQLETAARERHAEFLELKWQLHQKTGEAEKLDKKNAQLVSDVAFFKNEGALAGIQRLMNQADIRQMNMETLSDLQEILEINTTTIKEQKDFLRAKEFSRQEANTLCCVCLENKKCIIFFPCQHVCVCEVCEVSILKCPLDQRNIEQKFKAFL